MRVAIYARVSTVGKGQDTDNQLIPLREYANAAKLTISGEYVDNTSAGQGKTRESFNRLFNDARLRKFDLVLFWSLDRFSREGVVETLNHLNLLTSHKVGWKSYSEQYLDSTGIFKEAVIAILAAIAKQERVRISERVRAGMQRAYDAGKGIGRKPVDIEPRKLEALKDEGLSIRQIVARLASQGVSVSRASVQRLLAVPKGFSAPTT